MGLPDGIRTSIVVLVFAAVFAFLTVSSYTGNSATWDEPQHLTAGYVALTLGDYRLDPENPPFLGMWAALPLLVQKGITLDRDGLPREAAGAQLFTSPFDFCRRFLYQQNDADRLLYRGRFMIVLLGILLGILLFSWARELFGDWTAIAVLALYATEPNLLAHASLVTTDLGLTCFTFGTLYFLWRATRLLSVANLAGLITFFALAQVSKFSALLLVPILVLLLGWQVFRKNPWPCRISPAREIASRAAKGMAALAILLATLVGAYAALWAVYGFRYAPTPQSLSQARFETLPVMHDRLPRLTAAVNWVDAHHLLPNACAQGFLFGQTKAQRRSSFLAGQFRSEGRWYFFPAAFLLKTPMLVLLLFSAGAAMVVAQGRSMPESAAFTFVPIVVFTGAAMAARLNIGLRHLLPIYPFVLLLAGRSLFALRPRMRRSFLVLIAVFWALDLAMVYPHYLAFFSEGIGGARNGYRYLVDSNLDWGQDLKGLKAWMDQNQVRHINLSYFGSADPAYYGIDCTHLPGAPAFAASQVAPPRLPGYVAVSVTNLVGVYLGEAGRAFYRPLLDRKPDAVIGYSIHVYWVEQEWWRGPKSAGNPARLKGPASRPIRPYNRAPHLGSFERQHDFRERSLQVLPGPQAAARTEGGFPLRIPSQLHDRQGGGWNHF
jgi:dolichyl-phosphate-mannose-protein mannosyltransferase